MEARAPPASDVVIVIPSSVNQHTAARTTSLHMEMSDYIVEETGIFGVRGFVYPFFMVCCCRFMMMPFMLAPRILELLHGAMVLKHIK